MSAAQGATASRTIPGHLVVATVAGGGGGAAVAALGGLVAVLWPGGESPVTDPGALIGMPTVVGIFGAGLGLALGLVVGMATLGLRRRATPKVAHDVAWALAVAAALCGAVPLGWIWAESMGAAIVAWPAAAAFCLAAARPLARLGLRWLLGV